MITTLKISKLRLSKILMQIGDATLVKIKVEVPITPLKKFASDFKNLTQLVDMNIMINYDINVNDKIKFAKTVNGRTLPKTPLLLDNGNYYLKSRVLSCNTTTNFYNNNKIINPKLVVDKIHNIAKQNYNNVIMQDIAISNIREIQIGNINYIVKY